MIFENDFEIGVSIRQKSTDSALNFEIRFQFWIPSRTWLKEGYLRLLPQLSTCNRTLSAQYFFQFYWITSTFRACVKHFTALSESGVSRVVSLLGSFLFSFHVEYGKWVVRHAIRDSGWKLSVDIPGDRSSVERNAMESDNLVAVFPARQPFSLQFF